MLYKKNAAAKLDDSLFKDPTSEYRGTPFWAWNGDLDKDELLRQYDIFKQMGFGGAHLHVRTGLSTPYLSDEFMDDVAVCVEKAKKEDMLAYLYDEDRWPSGAAGGLVTKDRQYRGRYLLFTPEPYGKRDAQTINDSSSRAVRAENGTLIAVYDVCLDSDGCLRSYRQIAADDEAVGRKWYAYLEILQESSWYNGQTYVNTLDKKAIERFIQVTHERYKEYFAADFGQTIPSIFTDEPQFTRKTLLDRSTDDSDVILPWTDDLDETFFASYGCHLLPSVPELIWELKDGVSQVRYRYHDHIAERFASAFADTVGSWCDRNGIALTGHMMEEPTLCSQTASLGEAMRSYRSFGIPGIDMLCANMEFTTAIQARSAVHQFGREGMLSELYGVTGWDFDFRDYKLHGDWQAVCGVTVRVPHLAWYTMKGEAKRDYPASIFYQSPWYEKYHVLEDHFARVNTAMTRGKPDVRIGVIHPVESYWLHWGPNDKTALRREQLDNDFLSLTDWLLKGSCDFDFICESLLPGLCKEPGAPLKVGEMAYDAIVVPGCETLRSETVDILISFAAAGGRLIFMGEAPKYENALPSSRVGRLYERASHIPFAKADILEALAPCRNVTITTDDGRLTNDLIYSMRIDGRDRWLFVSHGCEPYSKAIVGPDDIGFSVPFACTPVIYDTLTGDKKRIPYSILADGSTSFSVQINEYDSLLVRLCADIFPYEAAASVRTVMRALPVPAEAPFSLSEPNVFVLDTAQWRLDNGQWQPEEELLRADNLCREALGLPHRGGEVAQPWTLGTQEYTHSASFRFVFDSDMNVSGASLALEDAAKASIVFNGEKVRSDITGWYVDKAIETVALPEIRRGENTLEIVWPFGERANIEDVFIVGDFGVCVSGRSKIITALPDKLSFSDITRQGLAFYGAAVTYHLDVVTTGGDLMIGLPDYKGAINTVFVDGREAGDIVFPPYELTVRGLAEGRHSVDVKLYIHRKNTFGTLHNANVKERWTGPGSWRTDGCRWKYEYMLTEAGILTTPGIAEISPADATSD